jgi:hypothetical protein
MYRNCYCARHSSRARYLVVKQTARTPHEGMTRRKYHLRVPSLEEIVVDETYLLQTAVL